MNKQLLSLIDRLSKLERIEDFNSKKDWEELLNDFRKMRYDDYSLSDPEHEIVSGIVEHIELSFTVQTYI